jgi:hypothetical protein
MEVSDTKPASVEELLMVLELGISSESAVVVVLTAVFVVGILDFKLPLLRRLGAGSSPGWLALFLPLPLIRSRAVTSAATWPPSFWAEGFLRGGCRRLVGLRGPGTVASTSGRASSLGVGASEVRALMAVKPGMMIERPEVHVCLLSAEDSPYACPPVAVDNTLLTIFAGHSPVARSS